MKSLIALALIGLLATSHALAGTACEATKPSPRKIAAAADMALRVADALEEHDAPVALVARHGQDLSKYGLYYSHVGFAVRDSRDGRWSVIHLLNDCGSDRSALYAQGLVDFFGDNLIDVDARIVWLQPDAAQRVANHLLGDPSRLLHEPRYNVIARPGSMRYQNSTAWLLENLAAILDDDCVDRRQLAQTCVDGDGFRSDRIHIAYGKRVLGGLFSANTVFTDHPLATRLAGDYPVVTRARHRRIPATLRSRRKRKGMAWRSPAGRAGDAVTCPV